MKKTKVFWFTGLSGSGKTTIANRAMGRLISQNKVVKVLDGDAIRENLHKHLGFTPEDIRENNRLIVELCKKYLYECDYIFVPVISPFRSCREFARKEIGSGFHLIYVKAPLETVVKRDVKGLYKKALQGQISHFIGIDPNVPYEIPDDMDLSLNTDSDSLECCVETLMDFVKTISTQ